MSDSISYRIYESCSWIDLSVPPLKSIPMDNTTGRDMKTPLWEIPGEKEVKKCNWCGSSLEKRDTRGNCINCGHPED